MDFCDQSVADYLEQIGVACGMSDWKAVRGGISDAMTFAMHGISSVNLSAGYNYEHTDAEIMNIEHGLDTIQFIVETITNLSETE